MEDDGLIRRAADLKDKRIVKIHLTHKGRQKRDVSKDTVIRFNKVVRERISSTQLATFHTVMGKINELLEQEEFFK
jgi:MarR family transcriptional regulator, organic hydroperoxide resistance regulator